MRTPEEIKQCLFYCKGGFCDRCPYAAAEDFSIEDCTGRLAADALAYINQLEGQLRDATKMTTSTEPVPKWISVEDRLPERNTRVLVYAQEKEDGFEGKYVITIASYTDNLFGYDISGWVEPWQYFFASYEITHWMPLPEPPREGTK